MGELKAVSGAAGASGGSNKVEALMQEMDVDGDEQADRTEFVTFMCKHMTLMSVKSRKSTLEQLQKVADLVKTFHMSVTQPAPAQPKGMLEGMVDTATRFFTGEA